MAAFFRSGDTKSQACVRRWYEDEIVPHSGYRDYIRRTRSTSEAKRLAKHYSSLSRFTHRSYRAILDGYVRARGDRLAHDRSGELYCEGSDAGFLVLPQTLASYFAVLANLIAVFADLLPELGLVTRKDVRDAFADSLEAETVPRRFYPRRWLAERLQRSEPKGHVPNAAVTPNNGIQTDSA